MPKGELFINNKDSYDNWGISMDTSSLSALMTPPPNKEFIENKSRLEHGKRVIAATPKVDERSLTLTINLTAKNEDEFFEIATPMNTTSRIGHMLNNNSRKPSILLWITLSTSASLPHRR
mgnify:CR=1 FL=1